VKTIWLVNYYAMPPELESRLRTIKFAYYLKKEGYNVRIIGSSAMHNKNMNLINSNLSFIEKSYDGIDFIHIKAPSYSSNGMNRFLSLFIFHMRLHLLRKKITKPDIIVHTALPPFGNITVYTARSLGAKYIVEVLDLWPESFVAYGLISKKNPILYLAYAAEKWLYAKADELVFSMEGGRNYIKDKKWDIESGGPVETSKVHYINNGVDLSEYDYFLKNYDFFDPDLADDSFKVIYLGSIRLANNIQLLIDAAVHLKSESNIKILIYGDGEDRLTLEEYAKSKNASNVLFKQKWISPEYVPSLLSKSSLNILNYRPNSVEKYGGSQSKLFQYLASGKPICSNLQYGNSIITQYSLGISKSFSSSTEYANAILTISRMGDQDIERINVESRRIAQKYDYQLHTKSLIKLF